MTDVQFHLRDINPDMVEAWRRSFDGVEGITISQGEIFGATADAVVSPANSFGYMDGGIDLVYSEFFGWGLQARLKKLIQEEHDGELPVGQAVMVETEHAAIPYLVSAPTMRIPHVVANTLNAYLAFRATIQLVKRVNREIPGKIRSVLCPGLCTAVGQMPHKKAAQQMMMAYLAVALGRTDFHDLAYKVLYNHAAMIEGGPLWSKQWKPKDW